MNCKGKNCMIALNFLVAVVWCTNNLNLKKKYNIKNNVLQNVLIVVTSLSIISLQCFLFLLFVRSSSWAKGSLTFPPSRTCTGWVLGKQTPHILDINCLIVYLPSLSREKVGFSGTEWQRELWGDPPAEKLGPSNLREQKTWLDMKENPY